MYCTSCGQQRCELLSVLRSLGGHEKCHWCLVVSVLINQRWADPTHAWIPHTDLCSLVLLRAHTSHTFSFNIHCSQTQPQATHTLYLNCTVCVFLSFCLCIFLPLFLLFLWLFFFISTIFLYSFFHPPCLPFFIHPCFVLAEVSLSVIEFYFGRSILL